MQQETVSSNHQEQDKCFDKKKLSAADQMPPIEPHRALKLKSYSIRNSSSIYT